MQNNSTNTALQYTTIYYTTNNITKYTFRRSILWSGFGTNSTSGGRLASILSLGSLFGLSLGSLHYFHSLGSVGSLTGLIGDKKDLPLPLSLSLNVLCVLNVLNVLNVLSVLSVELHE